MPSIRRAPSTAPSPCPHAQRSDQTGRRSVSEWRAPADLHGSTGSESSSREATRRPDRRGRERFVVALDRVRPHTSSGNCVSERTVTPSTDRLLPFRIRVAHSPEPIQRVPCTAAAEYPARTAPPPAHNHAARAREIAVTSTLRHTYTSRCRRRKVTAPTIHSATNAHICTGISSVILHLCAVGN